jgi:hypothetical protein
VAKAAPRKELTRNQAIQCYALMLTLLCLTYHNCDFGSLLSMGLTAVMPLAISVNIRAFFFGLVGLPLAVGMTELASRAHHFF